MRRKMIKLFLFSASLSLSVFVQMPSVHGTVAVPSSGYSSVPNGVFNYVSVGRHVYKSRIACAAACRQHAECQSVNMRRVNAEDGRSEVECDFQRRATSATSKMEAESNATYYCKCDDS